MKGYIYRVTNIANGRQYIGSTVSHIERRWYAHVRRLALGLHPSDLMNADYQECGRSGFTLEEVEEMEVPVNGHLVDRTYLEEREWHWANEAVSRGVVLYNRRQPTACEHCGRRYFAHIGSIKRCVYPSPCGRMIEEYKRTRQAILRSR